MTGTVVISGVAGGIGVATAKAFATAGWTVVGVDRREQPVAGVDHFVHANLAIEADSVSAFAEIGERFGRVDALVNNAATQLCKPLVTTTVAEWDEVMASNIRSAFLAIRRAVPLMKPNGGAIVNVSSVHAIATSANIAAYATSKGALLALTRALAIELAGERIRVNAVLPGAVDTPMLRAGLSRGHLGAGGVEEMLSRLGSRHPIGRVGEPWEIAQVILFLCDARQSSFVTGQALIADGGATAKLSTE